MQSIGEFAKQNNITVRALHHYEKMGLIIPSKVDESTGYRYYESNQAIKLELLLLLKDLGFSLSEIKELFQDGLSTSLFQEQINRKYTQSQMEIANVSLRFQKLKSIQKSLFKSNTKQINYKELIKMSTSETFVEKYGRDGFVQKATEMIKKAKQNNTELSCVTLDFDNFKKLNDTYGRDVGDIIIKRTTDTIINQLQTTKTQSIFERNGGDEFNFLVTLPLEDTVDLCNQIIDSIRNIDYSDIKDTLSPTVTIGIVEYKKDHESLSYLIHEATTAMFQAKVKKQKNTVNY